MNTNPDRQEAADPAPALPVRIVFLLVRLCGWLSAGLILVALAIIAYAVIQRYVMHSPLLWGDELLGYLLVAIVMFGSAEALRRRDHIAMDLFSANAGPKLGLVLIVWSDLAVLAFAVILGWSTWESVGFAMDFGSYSVGYIEIQTWIPQLPMLAGAALLGLVAVVRLLQSLLPGAGR